MMENDLDAAHRLGSGRADKDYSLEQGPSPSQRVEECRRNGRATTGFSDLGERPLKKFFSAQYYCRKDVPSWKDKSQPKFVTGCDAARGRS
jgi:hypothetical protein